MLKIKVEKTHDDAVIPHFAHPTDSGFDLYTCQDTKIFPGETVVVPTGLKFEIPNGWGIQIKNKSGITVKGVPVYTQKHGDTPFEDDEYVDRGQREPITVFEGTVDMNYRGEIGIMVRNDSNWTIVIPKQIKLAQGVLRKVYSCEFEEVDHIDTNTDRGVSGYGGSGVTLDESEQIKKEKETKDN